MKMSYILILKTSLLKTKQKTYNLLSIMLFMRRKKQNKLSFAIISLSVLLIIL